MPRSALISAIALSMVVTAASAQVDPVSGIDFVTIGDPGNPNWTGDGFNNNRGSVGYTYSIGRYEVDSAQWCSFMNAALDRPSSDRIPFVFAPQQWGAVSAPPINGGQRFRVPAGNEMLPTGGVDWRTSAIYCNWLCNGANPNAPRSDFLNGAYNVSTFGYQGNLFTDQLTHNPGSRYWIPTLDEWMKAAHWDPGRYGPGQGGWWLYSNHSDNPYVYGPPGVLVNGQPTTANASWTSLRFPGYDPFSIPLGAYANTMSPWGLFDVAGGTTEWLEEPHTIPGDPLPSYRDLEGSSWYWGTNGLDDQVGYWRGDEQPSFFGFDVGLRIASSIPSPAGGPLIISMALITMLRRRRG